MNSNFYTRASIGLVSAALLGLYGCGGGGGSGTTTAAATTTVDVPITVIDGPIQNAQVCLDINDNGVCDGSEPTGKTDADGKVNLKVNSTDVGKYAVIAVVGTDAIDVDTGAVPTPFTMKAPADQTTVITPLTTLVHNQMVSTGATSAAAEEAVKAQTGINVSLFQDFSKGTTDDHKSAANIARIIVVTTQQQSEAVKDAVGTKDVNNVAISKADLDKLVQAKVADMLAKMVELLSDPGVQEAIKVAQAKVDAASGTAKVAAQTEKDALIKAPAAAVIAEQGITKEGVALATAVLKAPVEAAAAAIGSTSLRSLAYTDARNYAYRLSGSTAAQNTIDSNGFYRYVFRQYKSVDGAIAAWNSGGSEPRRQADLHWNGSTWVACALNFENKTTARDAKGNNEYDYCDKQLIGAGYAGFSQDVAGQKMIDGLNGAVKAGYTSLGTPSTALTTALGNEIFPAGSEIRMGGSASLKTAPSYYPGSDNFVKVETSVACVTWSTQGAVYTSANAATLETMIAKFNGSGACNVGGASGSFVGKDGVTLSSGARNEYWGDTAISIGTIGSAATGAQADAVSYYTTNTRLRVGFGPKVNNGGVAKYYSCKERSDGSTRNCDLIGSGTYAITTLGDARMLSLATLPAISMALTWERKFIEIGGKVFFGYQDRPSVGKSVGLNTKATDAILAKLGLPAVNPEVPLALTAASYQGTYDMYLDSAPTTVVSTLTISAAGQNLCKDASGIIYTCTTTSFDPATGSFTTTTGNGTSVGVMRFLTGIPTGMYTPTSGTAAAFTMVRR